MENNKIQTDELLSRKSRLVHQLEQDLHYHKKIYQLMDHVVRLEVSVKKNKKEISKLQDPDPPPELLDLPINESGDEILVLDVHIEKLEKEIQEVSEELKKMFNIS